MNIKYIYNYNCMYSCFIILNMPINVFGNSSNNSDSKIDTGLFVQKPYLRSNYIESNIEEDINLKNLYRIKNVPDPINTKEACNKNYVDNLFNDSTIVKNSAHIDLNDKNITNARFIQVNQLPQIDSHLTAKLYVDNAISKVISYVNELHEINRNKLVDSVEVITIADVDQFHQEKERTRRDLGIDFYDESNDLVKNNQDNNLNDNKLTNIDSIKVNRNPSLDNELANKKYIDDELDKNTVLRFNQTLQNYLKVSVGNDTYNLTKYNKISITDITEKKFPNSGNALLQKWKIYCNNKNNQSRINDFIKSTKTNSPTGFSGATSLSPIDDAFMYIETSSNNHGSNVFVSWERTDIIQISNITFYYNRFSILTNDNLKNMGRFRIQLLLDDNTWSTQYTIDKNTQYSDSESDWELLNIDYTVENYGIKLILDQIETAHSDMCFSNITITHSVY